EEATPAVVAGGDGEPHLAGGEVVGVDVPGPVGDEQVVAVGREHGGRGLAGGGLEGARRFGDAAALPAVRRRPAHVEHLDQFDLPVGRIGSAGPAFSNSRPTCGIWDRTGTLPVIPVAARGSGSNVTFSGVFSPCLIETISVFSSRPSFDLRAV